MRPVPLEMEVWYFWERQEGQGVASPVQLARHVVLFKFTWQASWDRGARWRWVFLDLRDLLILSHNLGYHILCPLHRWSAGLSPVILCPLFGLHGRWGAGVPKSDHHGSSSSFSNLNAKSHNKCSCTELEISVVKALCPGVECSLYVDDFLIHYRSKHIHIIERHLQRCLNKLQDWANTNWYKFSTTKKVCIHFCRLRELHPDPQLFLNGSPIPVVEKDQFLGIIFWQKTFFFSAPMLS